MALLTGSDNIPGEGSEVRDIEYSGPLGDRVATIYFDDGSRVHTHVSEDMDINYEKLAEFIESFDENNNLDPNDYDLNDAETYFIRRELDEDLEEKVS